MTDMGLRNTPLEHGPIEDREPDSYWVLLQEDEGEYIDQQPWYI
jgi:hypothetical protein